MQPPQVSSSNIQAEDDDRYTNMFNSTKKNDNYQKESVPTDDNQSSTYRFSQLPQVMSLMNILWHTFGFC